MARTVYDSRTDATIENDNVAAEAKPPCHTLNFVNNSAQSGSVYLYQTNSETFFFSPVVWLAAPSSPGTICTFIWSIQYSIIWSYAGGSIVTAEQILPCDLITSNEATFTALDGFQLTDQKAGSPSGSIIIQQDISIPPNSALIGIGMSGSPTFVMGALPNMVTIITPNPTYWIGFSLASIQQGSILQNKPTNSAMIQFPPGCDTCTAILDGNGNWTLSYSV